MNLTREEIIREIQEGSEIGKEIFEIELSYYKDLARITALTSSTEEKKQ